MTTIRPRSAGDFAGADRRAVRAAGAGERRALAVSGGPDSTALLLMAARWARQDGRPWVEVATVDHAMRAGSREEAEAVAALSRRLGLDHHSDRMARAKAAQPRSGARARGALSLARRLCARDRRGFSRHRPSCRRSGRDGAVPPPARFGHRRPQGHGQRSPAGRPDARAAAARPAQGGARRLLRGLRRDFRMRSLERRSALCAHAFARALPSCWRPKGWGQAKSRACRAAPRAWKKRSPPRRKPPPSAWAGRARRKRATPMRCSPSRWKSRNACCGAKSRGSPARTPRANPPRSNRGVGACAARDARRKAKLCAPMSAARACVSMRKARWPSAPRRRAGREARQVSRRAERQADERFRTMRRRRFFSVPAKSFCERPRPAPLR